MAAPDHGVQVCSRLLDWTGAFPTPGGGVAGQRQCGFEQLTDADGETKVRPLQTAPEMPASQRTLPVQLEEPDSMLAPMQLQFDNVLAAIVNTKIALLQDIGAVAVGLGLPWAEHRK
ncbi:hypothetical protein NDU88_009663 [Pleurodeles waltl]|uniref:Uncharacterized protein n=1 Tax=Pleurodeles waltl TaxID=8319 RepID=A0AAV7PT38_PLEWA|nr:hypothetical protein NDU88_009663 [Pleurodeles waltl]